MTDRPSTIHQLERALDRIIVGQSAIVRQLLVALLTGGHVILEGVPGTGKTLLARAIAQLIRADFRRIQLTPDILPSDVVGTNIFDLNSSQFTLKKGPIFTEILLADEINRTPPKTQSALLEAMEERQVTIDGDRLGLPALFWVLATQNPLEFEGTYPLPEAQLDRFLFKLVIDYPDLQAEKQMLLDSQAGLSSKRLQLEQVEPITTVEEILQARSRVQSVQITEKVVDYLLELVRQSRQHSDFTLGASPRSSIAWMHASKAQAWLDGRDYVTPDDIKAVGLPLLRHRLMLRPEAQLDGVEVKDSVNSLLDRVAVPR
jgi:MoxR-like ATPase